MQCMYMGSYHKQDKCGVDLPNWLLTVIIALQECISYIHRERYLTKYDISGLGSPNLVPCCDTSTAEVANR